MAEPTHRQDGRSPSIEKGSAEKEWVERGPGRQRPQSPKECDYRGRFVHSHFETSEGSILISVTELPGGFRLLRGGNWGISGGTLFGEIKGGSFLGNILRGGGVANFGRPLKSRPPFKAANGALRGKKLLVVTHLDDCWVAYPFPV